MPLLPLAPSASAEWLQRSRKGEHLTKELRNKKKNGAIRP
jgi:hypothetical protein